MKVDGVRGISNERVLTLRVYELNQEYSDPSEIRLLFK